MHYEYTLWVRSAPRVPTCPEGNFVMCPGPPIAENVPDLSTPTLRATLMCETRSA